MKNYPLRVVSRRLMLVVGLSLIGVVFLFPAKRVEMRARSAATEQTLAVGRLAYTVTRSMLGTGTYTLIYTGNADGSGQVGLGFIGCYEPVWSPDGTKIAFSSNPSGNGVIGVMSADGTNIKSMGVIGRSPSWSVTGKIAFERNSQIWTINDDGTNEALFPGITQPALWPAWSFDGSKLAFVSGSDVWAINADGTGLRRITTMTGVFTAGSPAWSPDGLKIAFSKREPLPPGYPPGMLRGGLYVINADGTNETLLSQLLPDGTDDYPAWSSDGATIAFSRSEPPPYIYGSTCLINSDGTNLRGTGGGYNPAWRPVPAASRAHFDFDGDIKDDFAVYRAGATPTAQSYWDILRSSDNSRLTVPFGTGEDKIVPADYNGDGRTDIAVFRPSTGIWYSKPDITTSYEVVHWGIDGDIPLPGDFDGDGRADHAVFRPSEGVWYILRSSDGSFGGHQFGTSTDKPLLMDYDGDKKTDLAFLRVVGTDYYWYILQSSNNAAVVTRFGVVGDKAVPADYEGDGRSNLAVYRPETGKWMILNSDGTSTVEYQWGVTGDMPAPGNFDADGLTDLTVFRPNTTTWYVARSGGNPITKQWGTGTDMPVQAAYIP